MLPEQDHQAHAPIHQGIQSNQTYQGIAARAQAGDPASAALLQQINTVVEQHLQAHAQAEEEKQNRIARPGRQSESTPQGLIGQVRSNANETASAAVNEAQEQMA